MIRFVALLCLTVVLPVQLLADAGDRFFAAYMLIQQGDTAEAKGDWATARVKFSAALTILNEIKTQSPAWHTDLVAFRSQYCADHIAAVQAKAPVPPVVTPAEVIPAPPSDTEQVKQLQAELRKSHDAVKKLEEQRDKLAAELQTRLGEPAPTHREATKETLAQLRSLQAANEAAQAKLAAAEEKAARADQLAGELEQSQKKVRDLETGRGLLTTQLQEALAKVPDTQTSPQIEQLLKKNAEVTAQLADAQTEIVKLRDQVLAAPGTAPSAETITLRGELTQVRALLDTRTEELEKVKTENIRLTTAQEEILTKLAESDRQLRAAKASSEKGDQLIQQLRKENELLRQVATRQGTSPDQQAKKQPESGGFLWFKPKAKPVTPAPTNDVVTSQSEDGKLTVSVKAPSPPESAKTEAEDVKAAAEAATEAVEGSTEVRLLVGQARAAMATKDYATAKTHLATAAAKEPNNVSVLMNLGITLYQLNQLDEAQDTLRQAVAIAPNQGMARSLLGIICLRRGRTEDAYNELTRAVAIDPRNSEAHNYLGIVMNEKGWATAAEHEIRRALELNPEYADAHFNLAVMYSRQKTPRLELARYHYQKATDLGASRDEQLETALKKADAPKK